MWVLTGPTAVGKTALSLSLAEAEGLELVSMDSMLVYRGMDVGTAKPTPDELARAPHHGLDLVETDATYDVRQWLSDAERAAGEIAARGKRALFVGGTGLYLQTLIRGLFEGPPPSPAVRAVLEERARHEGAPALHAELVERDPRAAARIHPNDEKRVVRALEVLEGTGRKLSDWQAEWGWHGDSRPERPHRIVALGLEREALDARIDARVDAMLADGWDDEVRTILAGRGFSKSSRQALGYPEVIAWVEGRATRADTRTRIAQRTRRFARRQSTWFQRFPSMHWIQADAPDALDHARAHLHA